MRRAALDERLALGDPRARPSVARSWSSSRTISPSGPTRASRRASWRSISASRPSASGSSGSSDDDDPCQPDRLGAQLAADQRVARRRRVALVEHEVQDAQDAVEPLGQELGRRDAVGDPGVADLALGPDEALGEGRFRDEERPGDLGRRQAAERAQRQRHPRVHRERRMAAGEDEAQAVVGDRRIGVLRRAPDPMASSSRLDARLAAERLGLLDQALAAGAAGRWRGSGPSS